MTLVVLACWSGDKTSALSSLQNSASSSSGGLSDASVVLAGRVVNAITGVPVPRALVQAGSRAMLTDHDGRFRFLGLTEAVSALQITKPGFSLSPEQLDAPMLSLAPFRDRSTIEALLYPDAVLTGTVSAPDGTPLPHIFVTVRRSLFTEYGQSITPMARTQTDSHGNFRAPVPSGDYVVESEFTHLPYDHAQVVLPYRGQQSSLSNTSALHLHPGEEIHLDLSPTISPTHVVTIAPSPEQRGFPPRIVARSSSGFVISAGGGRNRGTGQMSLDLPNGTFTLEAVIPGQAAEEFGQSTFTVADHDVSSVPLHFAQVPAIPIEIALRPGGGSDAQGTSPAPPSPQQLSLSLGLAQPGLDLGTSDTVWPAMLGDRTSVFRVKPGRYRLHASSGSAWYVESATYGATNLLQQEMIVGPSVGATPVRIVVSNQTGSLNGSVKLSGVPAACWVYVIDADPSVSPISVQHSTPDGAFTFSHLPPGSYRIVSFEHKHSANFLDSNVLASFGPFVQSLTIQAGERSSISLDAVPPSELLR